MSEFKSRILVIDDTPVNLISLGAALTDEFDLQIASSGAQGLSLASQSPPDLILLDVMMPEMDGFETFQRLKADPRLKDIPVVFVTALTEIEAESKGLALGAADYILKPINVDIARHRIRNLLEREHLRQQLQSQRDRLEIEVAEREQTQRALSESEEMFRAVAQSSHDAIVTANRFGQIIRWNRGAEQIFGYVEAQVIGQPLTILMPKHLRQTHVSGMMRVQAGGAPRVMGKPVELIGLRSDGREFPLELSLAQWQTATGIFFTGVIRDITERKQAAADLRIAATAFESQVGMTITDAQNTILQVNKSFTVITGYSAQEAVGQTPRLLSSGLHDRAFYAAMWKEIDLVGAWQGEIWNRRKCGEVYPEWLTITAVKDDAGAASNYVATFTDITVRKSAEEQIKTLAFYDPLTGLPNRRLLMDRLEQALAASARHMRKGALLFVDLDNFKTINDTVGHYQGDRMLEQVAKRLATCVREGDTVARLGGDEFVVMLEDLSEQDIEAATQAETVAEKVLTTLVQTYQLGSYEHRGSASIGITLFGDGSHESIEEPLKRADLAMYQAKTAGRNTLRFFDPQMQAVVTARAAMEAGLWEALERRQFLLHYQAQVSGNHRITGVEALVRWQHPQRGLVPPAEFIPLSEETGLILPLGRWVLEAACAQLVQWAGRPEMANLTISVNVSAKQFSQADFVAVVLAVLESTGANPQRLKLELTESLLVTQIESVIAKMDALKARGVGFALYDFGTGYSSLTYLKRFPLDQLKIDQSFVRDILTDSNDAAIAKMVIVLAESLGLSVIAEGVETEAQRHFLTQQGCYAYQGYLFSRPLPTDEFEQFFRVV